MNRSARRRPASDARLPALPCGCANLRRAARAVSQVYDDELRAAGLNITQFTLLQARSLTRELTQRALGRLLALDSTTLTRTLKPLEGKGWIRRRPGEDRREKYIALTSAGRAPLGASRSSAARGRSQVPPKGAPESLRASDELLEPRVLRSGSEFGVDP